MQKVCPIAELVPFSGAAAMVDGQQVAIFSVPDGDEERIYAVGNYDPLGEANVLSRGIVGDIQGEPVVASPLYKQHFSLVSGACVEQADVVIPIYPVKVEDGWVCVGLPCR